MNEVEKMQGQVAALSKRIERLEELLRTRAAASGDELEAQRVAQVIGFPVEVLVVPHRYHERLAFMRELRKRGWSFARISRVLNCDEKTVRRWLKRNEE